MTAPSANARSRRNIQLALAASVAAFAVIALALVIVWLQRDEATAVATASVSATSEPSDKSLASPTPPPPTATPTATAQPSPSPESSLEPQPPPDAVTWREQGFIDTGNSGSIAGVAGFDAGYVAWGTHATRQTDSFAIWFSPDGRRWELTLEADQVAPCSGWTPRSNLEDFAAWASNGSEVILLGSVLDSPDRTTCDELRLITLSSADGVTWVRSEPGFEGGAQRAWAAPDGWRILSHEGVIWASADARTWREAGFLRPDGGRLLPMASAPDGTLLAARAGKLLSSKTGVDWQQVGSYPPRFTANVISAPQQPGSAWVVAISDFGAQEGRILSSTDLATWKSRPLQVNFETAWIVPWNTGRLAYTMWELGVTGCVPCPPPPPPLVLWSAEGSRWRALKTPDYMSLDHVATPPAVGPSGLLTVTGHTSAGVQVIRIIAR